MYVGEILQTYGILLQREFFLLGDANDRTGVLQFIPDEIMAE